MNDIDFLSEKIPQLTARLQIEDGEGFLLFIGQGYTDKIKIPPIAFLILSLIDGTKTVAQIKEAIEKIFEIPSDKAAKQFLKLLRAFGDYIIYDDTSSKKSHQEFPYPMKNSYNLAKLRRQISYRLREEFPSEIALIITRNCGLKCRYCFMGESIKAESYLDLDIWQKVVSEAVDKGCHEVFISGGEPFLVPNLCKYILVAAQNGCNVGVSTKCRVSKDIMDQLKNSGLKKLQVSLDSPNKVTNDFLAGKEGTYNNILTTVHNAVLSNIPVECRTVITKYNIREIPDILPLMDQFGVSQITFNHYAASCGRYDSSLVPELENIEKLDAWMLHNSNKYHVKVRYTYGRTRWVKQSAYYLALARPYCGAMRNAIVLREDGSVMFCNMLVNDNRFIVGNVYQNGISEIWNSDKTNALLNPDRALFKGTDCQVCGHFDRCMESRCYLRTLLATEKIYDVDPWCIHGKHDGSLII